MPKFIIHRTARRKADDMVIEAESERDAYEQMWDMANEGLFGVWNEYTDPWIEEIEDEQISNKLHTRMDCMGTV